MASNALRTLFRHDDDLCPIPIMMLLAHVVAHGTKGIDFNSDAKLPKQPRFRLTDLPLFASILRDIARDWEHGTIILSKHNDESLIILSIQLHEGRRGLRKRKRAGDIAIDSLEVVNHAQSGGVNDHTTTPATQPSIFDTLHQDLQGVYAISLKGTAKGRIMAEQASFSLSIIDNLH